MVLEMDRWQLFSGGPLLPVNTFFSPKLDLASRQVRRQSYPNTLSVFPPECTSQTADSFEVPFTSYLLRADRDKTQIEMVHHPVGALDCEPSSGRRSVYRRKWNSADKPYRRLQGLSRKWLKLFQQRNGRGLHPQGLHSLPRQDFER